MTTRKSKIQTQKGNNAEVSVSKKGGYNSESSVPRTQKEFALGSSIVEVAKLFTRKKA